MTTDSQSRLTFLKEKAQNFRGYLESMKPSPEAATLMGGFHEGMLMTSILTLLVPAARRGELPGMADQVVGHLTAIPPGTEEAVKARVLRYLTMFADVGVN